MGDFKGRGGGGEMTPANDRAGQFQSTASKGISWSMHRQRWTLKKIFVTPFTACWQHIPRDVPLLGRGGHLLRGILCRPLLLESARIIGIGLGVDFDNGCFVRMKECANIGDHALLAGSHGTITIGRHVMMGKQCTILCQNHRYREEGYDGHEGKDVLIDDYAWLGHRVIVLPGVRVGKHAIIGAGAVVSKSIPDYAIAVGNPAVVKKYRKCYDRDK
ncbi:MAG: acyltransferase [Thermodesulfobacteriota bacterium]